MKQLRENSVLDENDIIYDEDIKIDKLNNQ